MLGDPLAFITKICKKELAAKIGAGETLSYVRWVAGSAGSQQ